MSTCCTWPFRVVLVAWPVHAFINPFYMHVTCFSLSSSLCHSPVLLHGHCPAEFSFMWACRPLPYFLRETVLRDLGKRSSWMHKHTPDTDVSILKFPTQHIFIILMDVCMCLVCAYTTLCTDRASILNLSAVNWFILKCIFPTPALFFKWIHPDILVWMWKLSFWIMKKAKTN